VRYLLMFYADEDAWMALAEDERNAAIGRIGRWFGEEAAAGRIVEGKRLAGGKRATTTVPSCVGGGVATVTRVSGTTSPCRGHSVRRRHASSRGSGAMRWTRKLTT